MDFYISTLKVWEPTKNEKYCMLKGWGSVSVPPMQYSPRQIRKRKVTQKRLLISRFCWVTDWKDVSKDQIMDTRRGQTLVGGGFSFIYVSSWRPKRKTTFPSTLCWGSWAPTAANIFTIDQRYLLT